MQDELKKIFDINETSELEFQKRYGFTFVFERKIYIIKDQITSAEIKPLGLIYEENDEYYFAPLDNVENTDAIVKEFVKKILIK